MKKEYTIPKEKLGHKRTNYSSWDENFMLHAVVASARSKDPSSQVGACIVGNNNRILSLGYNGAPNTWDDKEFPWDREAEDYNHTKYPYVIHGEMNALLNYKGDNKDLIGSTVYVTLFPCSNFFAIYFYYCIFNHRINTSIIYCINCKFVIISRFFKCNIKINCSSII